MTKNQERSIKLINKFPNLALVKYAGCTSKESIFWDSDFGEFKGVWRSVIKGQKVHPERSKLIKSAAGKSIFLTEQKAKENISSKYDDIILIRYYGHNQIKSLFYQKTYGYFWAIYQNVLYGHAAHPGRFKLSFAQAKENIFKRFKGEIELLEFTGRENVATFNDASYGKFTGVYKEVYNYKCIHPKRKTYSKLERNFFKLLEENNYEFTRTPTIAGRKADVLLKNNVIIELDGLYFHSDANRSHKVLENTYHLNKYNHYVKHGYKPFFFRESEVNQGSKEILSILDNYYNPNKQPNNFEVKEINLRESILFYQTLPVYISVDSSKAIGVFVNSQLYSVINLEVLSGKAYLCHYWANDYWDFCLEAIITFLKKQYQYIEIEVIRRYDYSARVLEKLHFTKKNTYLEFNWTDKKHIQMFGTNSKQFKIHGCGIDVWEYNHI